MSEVFTDTPSNSTTMMMNTTTNTTTTNTTTDLERYGGGGGGGGDVYDVDDDEDNKELKAPTTVSAIQGDPAEYIVESPTTTVHDKNKAVAPMASSSSSSFLNYTNIVTCIIMISIFVTAIYGILQAAGAFDTNDKDNLNQQNNNMADNVITDICDLNSNNTVPFDIRGDGSLLLRQYINTNDNTVTIQVEYNDIGWIGFAFSESDRMIPNTAIIGLPDTNTVQKYSLTSKSLSGVTPLSSTSQTLTDASIVQEDGNTILTFTKNLVEDNEVTVVSTAAGSNSFNWAIGNSNTLAFHADRGSTTLNFNICLGGTSNGGAPVISPTLLSPPTPAPILRLPTDSPIVSVVSYEATTTTTPVVTVDGY